MVKQQEQINELKAVATANEEEKEQNKKDMEKIKEENQGLKELVKKVYGEKPKVIDSWVYDWYNIYLGFHPHDPYQ